MNKIKLSIQDWPIRRKLFLAFIFAILASALLSYGILYTLSIRSLSTLERDKLTQAISSTEMTIHHAGEELRSFTEKAYAVWTRTYDYVQTLDPGYRVENFEDLMNDRVISMILVINSDGIIVDQMGDFEEFFVGRSMGEHPFWQASKATDEISYDCLYLTSRGPYQVAVSQILQTDRSGPSAGLLVLGNALDEAYEAELSEQLGFPVRFESFTAWPDEAADLPEERIHLLGPNAVLIEKPLYDLTGRPIAGASITFTRDAINQVKKDFMVGTLVLGGVGFLITLAFSSFLSARLLSPVLKLKSAMRRIIRSDDYSDRVEMERRDELGALAGDFNQLLESLEKSRSILLEKNQLLQDKQERIDEDLRFAEEIHKSLVPASFSNERMDVAVSYVPMQSIGGDYANFRLNREGTFKFIVTDITGHGVPAALVVNRLHTEVQRLIGEEDSPGAAMNHIDRFVKQTLSETRMFLSAFCGALNFNAGELTYSNFGHPPALLRRRSEKRIDRLDAQTAWVGAPLEHPAVSETQSPITKGDRLVIYTDGVNETKGEDGELFGLDRLEALLKDHKGTAVSFNTTVLRELDRFREGEVTDDIFILTIDVK